MKIHLCKVDSRVDPTQSGRFWATTISTNSGDKVIDVEYCSPIIKGGSGFFAPPLENTDVLVAEMDILDNFSNPTSKFYYICSVNDVNDGRIFKNDRLESEKNKDPVKYGKILNMEHILEEIYESTKVLPQIMFFNSHSGNGLFIRDRGRADDDTSIPWQDSNIELKSSTNKFVQLVDSPQLDYVRITNGHPSDEITFTHDVPDDNPPHTRSAHELNMRTQGRIALNSTDSEINLFIAQNGSNIVLDNHADGFWREGIFHIPPGNINALTILDPPIETLSYVWDGTLSASQVGDESYGCIILETFDKNITLNASGDGSVIRIVAPGANTKIIIDTGGSVNVRAKKDIILSSDTEVSINAPTVRIQSDNTYIVGTESVRIN